ncbi:MAG: TonB-dependent receptor, partial [Ignavibacteriaceae bacterium]
FDYFNPNTTLPVDLRNPLNNINFPGAYETRKAKTEYQISPRFGVSFPISDEGAIHFSYGHFFQIPSFDVLYSNNAYLVDQTTSLSSLIGNPELKAQKTVKYELGLQQVLFPNISIDASVYYSDIRNLLGTEVLSTYEGFLFGRYINRDYGNVKGLVLTLEKRYADLFSAKIDYTYQVAQGNASDPLTNYNNLASDPPVEETKRIVPLNWDQTSTLNISFSVGDPFDWTASMIFNYGSGTPYTEDPRYTRGLRFENNGRKPSSMNVDLKATKNFNVVGLAFNTYLLIYNLFDIKNEYGVSGTTGRAGIDLAAEEYTGTIYGVNTKNEYLLNPQNYSAPRQIRVGFGVGF